MKVSLNQIRQFIDFELPPVDELVSRINQQLGSVEEVVDLAAKYKDAVIVKVVEAEKHPNADRLNVTKIDDGGIALDVPRDENGLVQVVCGAPNVRAGMFAVWLPPKSTVPASFDDAEPFVLGARELRGIVSQGMLAAADELAIGTDHAGIVEINPSEWKPTSEQIKPGANFAKVYRLDDTIIDIENKMFTHRPDLFGQLGVAREIAGILGHKFTSPNWYFDMPKFKQAVGLELEVFNEANEKVPRVMFAAMKNIEIKPSPLWLQCALVAMGSKSINNIVDATNYVMLISAQPTHAYDYDKIRGARIGARMARAGEKVHLLNNKTYSLTKDDIVIADAEGPVGLGGIMGGGDSEVDENTKNIVLEVATFDMYTVRKSAMRHGIFTDALTRFNKGQSPHQNDHIMNLLIQSIKDVSDAEQASDVIDLKATKENTPSVTVAPECINDRLGLKLSSDEMEALLRNVEIRVEDGLIVAPPFWRTDIEIPEDVVEEVGRLYGFDKLPRELPRRSIKPAPENKLVTTKQLIRESLAAMGANEVLSYSFVDGSLLSRAGQDIEHAYRLSNALSPDLQYYRLSLIPSLIGKVHTNVKAGYDNFALFEIGKVHDTAALDDSGLPLEFEQTAFVYTAQKPQFQGATYYQAKYYLDNLLAMCQVTRHVRYSALDSADLEKHEWLKQLIAPFEGERLAVLHDSQDGSPIGVIGEFRPEVTKQFKLPEHTAGFEVDTLLFSRGDTSDLYTPLSKYPSVSQDISLKVPRGVSYHDVHEATQLAVEKTRSRDVRVIVKPLDIYAADSDASDKTFTFRLTLTALDRTLRDIDAKPILEAIRRAVEGTFAA